jgi:hypothetical protein
MNKTFEFAGRVYSVYTNGKIYNGIQYVKVSRVDGYEKATEVAWDHNSKNWKKRPGNPAFDIAVAHAFGQTQYGM